MSTNRILGKLRSRVRGVSLVELLISLVLGLLVVGGAITVFMSNRQTYRATENLGRMQENMRVGFELMSRDLREAGANPCEGDLPVGNALNNADDDWWSTWGTGVRGFGPAEAFPDVAFGTAAGERIDGTEAVEIKSAISAGVTVADHQPTSAQFQVNTVNHGLDDGDIALVCDFHHAVIFQISNASPGINDTVVHNTGTGTPGNADNCLDVVLDAAGQVIPGATPECDTGPNATYAFGCADGTSGTACPDGRRCQVGTTAEDRARSCRPWNATIAKLQASRWYIGANGRVGVDGRAGRSLYRANLRNTGGVPVPVSIEIAENVDNLQLAFLQNPNNGYVTSAWVTDWAEVSAIRVTLSVVSPELAGTNNERLARDVQHTVTLRNRAP